MNNNLPPTQEKVANDIPIGPLQVQQVRATDLMMVEGNINRSNEPISNQPPSSLPAENQNPNNRRHKYTEEMKQYAVDQYKTLNNYCKAAVETQKKYTLSNKIDESSVREWVNSKKYCTQQDIDNTKKKKQARDLKGRINGLDAHIKEFLTKQRKNKVAVNQKMIKEEAKQFASDPDFKASTGWWEKTRKRLKIVMRMATHVIQKLCSKSGEEIRLYLARIQKMKMENLPLTKSKTILVFGNFDEVPLQFDMVSGRTYDFQGKKEIGIQTTSGVKMRVTVLMSILSNSVVLPPLFVFKTKKAIPKEIQVKYADSALVYSNAKGWIAEDLLLIWLERIWLNLKFSENEKPILIFDQCRVHTTPTIIKFLTQKKITYEVIPAGTTGYLQPLDVSINKPLKNHIKDKFDKWYANYGSSAANTTNKGYRRPPSFDKLIGWTIDACKEINAEILIHSFETTGLISSGLGIFG